MEKKIVHWVKKFITTNMNWHRSNRAKVLPYRLSLVLFVLLFFCISENLKCFILLPTLSSPILLPIYLYCINILYVKIVQSTHILYTWTPFHANTINPEYSNIQTGTINEPPLPRRKKCPELAYKTHEFITCDQNAHRSNDLVASVKNSRARVSVKSFLLLYL